MNKNQTNQSIQTPATKQQYVAPNIEIIDIEMEQNILGGSGTTTDMSGEAW